MTILGTAFLALFGFVIGQLIVKLVVDPVHELKKQIGRVASTLAYEARVLVQPELFEAQDREQLSLRFRRLGINLRVRAMLIPYYATTARWLGLPSGLDIDQASATMILLSNRILRSRNDSNLVNTYLCQMVSACLGIWFTPDDQRVSDAEYREALRGEKVAPNSK